MRIVYRPRLDLTGFWGFRVDPERRGTDAEWCRGLVGGDVMAVPASWNGQVSDYKWYMGHAWYEKHFFVPQSLEGQAAWLDFDRLALSVDGERDGASCHRVPSSSASRRRAWANARSTCTPISRRR